MSILKPDPLPGLGPDAFKPPKGKDKLRIIPLGGCGEFGMNLTAYLFDGRLYVVDCGIMFPDPSKLGIDGIVPKVEEFFEAAGGVHAYLITHGHEDHIGALPYISQKWPAPIYTPSWSAALLRNKIERFGGPDDLQIIEVNAGESAKFGEFHAEFIHVNHSIPMSCALGITAGSFRIFHSGDFKCDDTPVGEPVYNQKAMKAFGAKGVDLMLADSTNAHKPGRCPSETETLNPSTDVIRTASGLCVFTVFSSNLWRLRTIAEATAACGKELIIAGTGIKQTIKIADEFSLFDMKGLTLCEEDELPQRIANGAKRSDFVLVATGSQGEWRAALARMTFGTHRSVQLQEEDRVVFSSRMIPGNERSILGIHNRLQRIGSEIITNKEAPGIHVSGHGHQEDLQILVDAVQPRFFLPVHGAIPHLLANQKFAAGQSGKMATALFENGNVVDLTKDQLEFVGCLETDTEWVDAFSRVVLPKTLARERLKVGELGAYLISGVFDRQTARWLKEPQLKAIGLDLPCYLDHKKFYKDATDELRQAVAVGVAQGLEEDDIKETSRIAVRKMLSLALNKKPVVIPSFFIL